jgi:hypothetical protein
MRSRILLHSSTANATREVIHLCQLISETLNAPITETTIIYEDNHNNIAFSYNAMVSDKTKHIDVRNYLNVMPGRVCKSHAREATNCHQSRLAINQLSAIGAIPTAPILESEGILVMFLGLRFFFPPFFFFLGGLHCFFL